MRRIAALIFAGAILVLWGFAAEAADRSVTDNGHALARAWCASCHAVEPGEKVGPFADVPSFAAVARMPSTTAAALHAFLNSPHHDMPDIKLSAAQINEIVDYILDLRGQEGRANP